MPHTANMYDDAFLIALMCVVSFGFGVVGLVLVKLVEVLDTRLRYIENGSKPE